MKTFFVNMPLSWIADDRTWLRRMIAMGIRPELGLDVRSMDERAPAWHRGVADELRDAGLACSVHLPFIDLVPGSPDPVMRQASQSRLERAMDLVAIHQPELCIAHAAFFQAMYQDQEAAWLEAAVTTWSTLDAARPEHPPIFLENVFETDPAPLADLIAQLPQGRFGVCLDIGHWHCFARGHAAPDPAADLERWLDALAPRLGHLHLHDNDGSFDQHLGLGLGTIPLDALWQGLDRRGLAAGHNLGVTLEPHTEQDLMACLDYLESHPHAIAPPRG